MSRRRFPERRTYCSGLFPYGAFDLRSVVTGVGAVKATPASDGEWSEQVVSEDGRAV